MILMPLSAHWSIGEAAVPGVLPLYVSPVLFYSDLALAGALIFGLIWPRAPISLSKTFGLPLLALALAAFLTAPFALVPGLALYTALRWLIACGAFLCLAQPRIPGRIMIVYLTIGLGVQTFIGLAQVVVRGPLGIPGELALPIDHRGAAILEAGQGLFLRPYGLTFHPNVFGGYLLAGLLVGLPMLGRRLGRVAWWILWMGLLLSFSRSAWLAAIATIPLAAWMVVRKREDLLRPIGLTLLGALLITGIGALVLARPLSSRLRPMGADTERRSTLTRARLGLAALETIREDPVTGVGAGVFPAALAERYPGEIPEPVHNLPLLLSAEVGLAGGALWIWLVVFAGATLIGRWRSLTEWTIVFLAGWLALAVIGLFDSYPWALNSGRLLSVSLLGLAEGSQHARPAVQG